MRLLRWIEALSGVLASIAGGAAIVYLLSVPTYAGESCRVDSSGEPPICVTSTATLVQINGSAAVVDLGIIAVLLAGIVGGAVWHSATGHRGARGILWGCAGVLTLFALLALLTIGRYLLPGVALAVVASLCALAWPRIPRRLPSNMTPAQT